MRKFFISDLHFGHKNIIHYQKDTRKFMTVEEMDNHMIECWNKVVYKKDRVYVIGDFSFYRDIEKTKEILSKLNGNKILIRGNHDLFTSKQYIEAGFEDVRDELLIKLSNKKRVLLKHYPYYNYKLFNQIKDYLKLRKNSWRNYYTFYPINKGFWHIHGHHHGGERVIGKEINVNVDSWNFKPVSESEIISIMEKSGI